MINYSVVLWNECMHDSSFHYVADWRASAAGRDLACDDLLNFH